jgi:hypothetical protein
MPNARANRGDIKPTPEPDAPVRFAHHGPPRRSASFYPVAGPRVCEREDRALLHELERLFQERLDDAHEIVIMVVGGCVLLQGSVSCPLARLLAEDLVFAKPEVWECHNQLVVRTKHDRASLAA